MNTTDSERNTSIDTLSLLRQRKSKCCCACKTVKQAHLCLPKLLLQAEAQGRRPEGTFSAPLLAFDRPAWYASAASSSCRPGVAKQACAGGQFETARSAKGTVLKITSPRRKSMSRHQNKSGLFWQLSFAARIRWVACQPVLDLSSLSAHLRNV